jgi:hypothetical protein
VLDRHERTIKEASKASKEAKAELQRFQPTLDEVRRIERLFAERVADRRERQEPYDGVDRRR